MCLPISLNLTHLFMSTWLACTSFGQSKASTQQMYTISPFLNDFKEQRPDPFSCDYFIQQLFDSILLQQYNNAQQFKVGSIYLHSNCVIFANSSSASMNVFNLTPSTILVSLIQITIDARLNAFEKYIVYAMVIKNAGLSITFPHTSKLQMGPCFYSRHPHIIRLTLIHARSDHPQFAQTAVASLGLLHSRLSLLEKCYYIFYSAASPSKLSSLTLLQFSRYQSPRKAPNRCSHRLDHYY